MTLLTDGPTSSSLAWVFERLLRHPEKLARLQEEVLAGEDDTYLDAVVKETLRLCPPVPVVVRRLLKPMELGGYDLPAGTMVAPCVYLIHHHEEIYPKPRQFLPERFLSSRRGTDLDPLRRRHPPLPRRQLRRTGDEAGAAHGARARSSWSRSSPDSERVTRSAIAFSPDKRGRVVAEPRTPPPHPSPSHGSRVRSNRSRRRRQGRGDRDQGAHRSTGSASGRSRC